MQTPDPSGHREKREDMKATIDSYGAITNRAGCVPTTWVRAESQRLRVSWWRPSPDRKYGARPGGSVPKRGRPSSRSATRQSRVANRASEAFPERMLCQGPGDRTWSRQTSTPAHHRREATAREEPVRANRRKAAHSEGCPQAPGRRPSTRSGDACRDWLWKLAGLTPVLRSI